MFCSVSMEQARRWAIKKQAAVCTTQMQVHCAWRVSGWQVDTALSIVSTRTKIWYSKRRYWARVQTDGRGYTSARRTGARLRLMRPCWTNRPGVLAHRRSLIIAAAGLRHRLTSIIELLACGPGRTHSSSYFPLPGIHRSYGHMGFMGTIGLGC